MTNSVIADSNLPRKIPEYFASVGGEQSCAMARYEGGSDVRFCPTEKPDRVLASKSRTCRLFRRIDKALFDFKPNALEPGIERHGNAFIFDLDRFEPSRVNRYGLSISYLVDPQPIKG
jgi:hypothetical protein